MRPASRLTACLLFALALAGQGLLSHAARAAQVAATGAAPALCLTDPQGSGHGPEVECTVHCLLAGAPDAPGLPSATAEATVPPMLADPAGIPPAPPLLTPLSLDYAARAPPGRT